MKKNIFYFEKIMPIGGTEQFLYEIAKKYKDRDITIYYDQANPEQIKRLSKLVRFEQHQVGKIVECEKAFFNYNIGMAKDTIGKKYFVSHANFEELGYKPPIDKVDFDGYIGVSEFASSKLDQFAKKLGKDIKTKRCYNPLTLEPVDKPKIIVVACRLEDKVKGGERTKLLIKELDEYAKEHNKHYLMLLFTNSVNERISSKNVAIMKPRTDVRPYIAMADIVAQLSNDMETYCYTLNEAWGYGVHTISTPQSVLKELPIPDGANYILNFDCSNIKDVVRHIFEDKLEPFNYTPPEDSWDELLAKGESTYKEETDMEIKVRALDTYEKLNAVDTQLGIVPKAGTEFMVKKERLDTLLGANRWCRPFVEVVKEHTIETATPEKRAIEKKTTKNVKKRPIQK